MGKYWTKKKIYGKETVLLVLIDGARVGDGIGMLDDRDGFAGQDRLVDTDSGRIDFDQSGVGGDFVADRYFDDVAGYELFGADHLNTVLIRSYHFRHFGFVLFQSFDGTLGVSFLKNSADGMRASDVIKRPSLSPYIVTRITVTN